MGGVCHRCEADRQPEHFGMPRQCAFGGDVFSSDNWSCATMDVFRGYAYDSESNLRRGDTSIATAPVFPYDQDWVPVGWIVMTYYKDRGCTDKALYVPNSDDPVEPLTWEIADRAANVLEEARD